MLRYRLLLLALAIVTLLTFASCAKEVGEANEIVQARVLDSWINVKHPGSEKTSSGLYIIDFSDGTGRQVTDSSYVFVKYTVKELSGNILATNDRAISEQLGEFSYSRHYGYNIWRVDQEALYAGVEEILKRMRVGGRATVAFTPELATLSVSIYSLFSSLEGTAPLIFELELVDCVEDIYADYEEPMLRLYSEKYWGGVDTVKRGFYFVKTKEVPVEDSIATDAQIKIRYIGHMLEGVVFDTNIQDTAKRYRIYESKKSYEAMDITFKDNIADFKQSNSIIEGFADAIMRMRYGEKAVAFFWSQSGYGATGSSPSIPEYTPLCFEVEVERKN